MTPVSALRFALTPAQLRFAEDHRAVPGVRPPYSDTLIFLYRSGIQSTERWLVDDAGRIVDAATFK